MISGAISAGTNTDNEITPPSRWSKVKSILIYLLIAVLFVSIALTIAVVYTGKEGLKSERDEIYQRSIPSRRFVIIEKYPFLAAVFSEKPYLFLCSAMILNRSYLLTSANCYTVLFPNIVIRTESSLWNRGGKVYEVEKVMVHEEYDSTNFENNLAVIKIKGSFDFGASVQSAKIHDSDKVLQEEAILIGWGTFHMQLFQIKLKECYEDFCIPSDSICDRGLSGIIVKESKCIGIWSLGNIEKGQRMIFTPISPYKNWIEMKSRH